MQSAYVAIHAMLGRQPCEEVLGYRQLLIEGKQYLKHLKEPQVV